MKIPTIAEVASGIRTFEYQNRAVILTVAAVASQWAALYFAFKDGPKAAKILKEKKEELEYAREGTKPEIVKETVKEVAPVVARAVIFEVIATACTIGSNRVSESRLATLASAYAIANNTLTEYRAKTREVVGEKKEQQIREAVSRDHVQTNPPPADGNNIIVTGNGNVLCYDEYRDLYFYSCAERIGEAILDLSYQVQNEMWVSLNDFWYLLGLPTVKGNLGNDYGWSDNALVHGKLPIKYTATLTPDKRPCLAIQYDVEYGVYTD